MSFVHQNKCPNCYTLTVSNNGHVHISGGEVKGRASNGHPIDGRAVPRI